MWRILCSSINRIIMNLFLEILLIFTIIGTTAVIGQEAKTDQSFALNTLYPDLSFSTFLGGNGGESGYDIAIATDGSCYVTGNTESSNFPTKNAFDLTFNGNNDAFVTKFIETTTSTKEGSAYGLLAFVVVPPMLVLILV